MPIGFCQSIRAAILGLLAGAAIERRVGPKAADTTQTAHDPAEASREGGRRPVQVSDVLKAVERLEKRLAEALKK